MSLLDELGAGSDRVWRYHGLYAGVVTDNQDPLQTGRVQVRVPSVYEQESGWARPCFPYGHVFVPAVDDQIWVAFEDGDPASPVWLGVWYPSGKVPETAAGGITPPVQRLVRSESGHTLLFDDSAGAETVRIQDKTGSYVELGPGGVTIHCEQPLTISAPGQAITVTADAFDVKKG